MAVSDLATPRAIRLRTTGLCKDYSVRVLDRVDFELAAGEVHALVGANGAGKSTLCRIFSGLLEPSAGEMTLDGEPYLPGGKRQAEERGVEIVQQELHLLPTLTVAENLFLSRLPHRLGWIDVQRLHRRARGALERVGLAELDPRTPLGALGVGARQLVEIAAALERQCRVLILDEPTAALTAAECERLFAQIRELREKGVSVLYVSHRLDEVRALSDRLTILRDGLRIATRETRETSLSEMVSLMTGEELAAPARFESHRRDEVALRVERLSSAGAVHEVSFSVRRGERLGVAGLVGAGRSELLRALFGAEPVSGGALYLGSDPRPLRFSHPRQAVRRGLALVTEDRKLDGLLLPQPVRVNTTLARLPRRGGWLARRRERERAQARREDLEILCQSLEQPAAELSGGNQQKVVVAKWLETEAEVLLLDEPTRGIDVAARRRIDRLFDQLARQGKALVIVSSDLDELMELCDRIVVLSHGRLVEELERDSWSRQAILAAAFGRSQSLAATSPEISER